jgi:F0F1-type ATP synthase assembly protein I
VSDDPNRDPEKRDGNGRGDVSWNQGLVVAGLAMTIPGLLFGPPAVGYYLDSAFGTSPWITVIGFVVGLIGTAIDLFVILKRVGLME